MSKVWSGSQDISNWQWQQAYWGTQHDRSQKLYSPKKVTFFLKNLHLERLSTKERELRAVNTFSRLILCWSSNGEENQDVVHVSYTITTQERAKRVVNHSLKDSGSVLQPKWHCCILKHARLTLKHRIQRTIVYYGNLVESIFEVNLWVNFRARDGGNYIVQEGKGVIISLYDVVQSSIIYTDAQFAGRLGDQDNQADQRQFWQDNNPFLQLRVNVFFQVL